MLQFCDEGGDHLSEQRGTIAIEIGAQQSISADMAESCDSDSFARMYSELRRSFEATAYSILGNKEDAEDAVQDALVSGYANLQKFEGRSKLATWFTRIVVNSSLMLRRKRKVANPRAAISRREDT